MKEENKRKSIILMAIGVLTLLIVVGGATYAYFQAQTGASKNVDISATTGTTDNLTFAVGDAIDIKANMTNFAQVGGSNQAGETTATATLTKNSTTEESGEYTYNIYLQVLQNDFDYSNYTKKGADPKTFLTKEAKEEAISKKELEGYTPEPELYLTVIGPDGEEKNIEGIGDYYSDEFQKDLKVSGNELVGGYDITTLKAGVYALKSKYPIKVESTENGQDIDNWQIRVTFKWFQDLDQQLNAGKKFQAKIIIQQEEMVAAKLLADAVEGTLIYHNGTTMAPAQIANTKNTSIIVGGYTLTDKANGYEVLYAGDDSEFSKALIKYYCNGEEKYTGYAPFCGSSQYYTLVYDDGQTQYKTYKQALQQAINEGYVEPSTEPIDAGDESYRYSGSSTNVHNYVCLDSETEVTEEPKQCTTEEDLYRIIGLFKNDGGQYEMKLIKATAATKDQLGTGGAICSETYCSGNDYYWARKSDYTNLWKDSLLNTINLNAKPNQDESGETHFKDYLEQEKPGILGHITDHKWITAGNTSSIISPKSVIDAYKNEIVHPIGEGTSSYNKETDETYTDQIGLMYVSDYGYAAYPEAWTTILEIGGYNNADIKANNWMQMNNNNNNTDEWTITRHANHTYFAFFIDSDGYVSGYAVHNRLAVRPSFYLSSDTKIVSGNGTNENPYRISW